MRLPLRRRLCLSLLGIVVMWPDIGCFNSLDDYMIEDCQLYPSIFN